MTDMLRHDVFVLRSEQLPDHVASDLYEVISDFIAASGYDGDWDLVLAVNKGTT